MIALKPTDYLVIGIIVAVAAAPLLVKAARAAAGGVKWPSLPRVRASVGTREHWVQTLMQLQSELEAKPEQAPALKLCRSLIWELLGGGPTP